MSKKRRKFRKYQTQLNKLSKQFQTLVDNVPRNVNLFSDPRVKRNIKLRDEIVKRYRRLY